MSTELSLAKADTIAQSQHELAIRAGVTRIDNLMSDLGSKVQIKDQKMVLTDIVDPDEALSIMFRLKHEVDAGGTALKFIRLWQGDFCSAFASQMGIPMSRAANELADVFGEKPKRILRLVNTSERSPQDFREANVDYTVLQDLADLPVDKDPEVAAKTEEAKKTIIDGLANHGKDRKWMKSTLDSIKTAVDAEVVKQPKTLEDYLVQYYNLGKFYADCADADECQRILDSMKAIEPSIENLSNSRGHKLYFEMDSAPLVQNLEEEANIDEIIQ